MTNNVKITPPTSMTLDSLVNFASGLGISGKDKRADSRFEDTQAIDWIEYEALYRDDWIAGKIVDILSDDMTRKWRSFSDSSLTPAEITKLRAAEKRLKLKQKTNLSKKWSRLYGGCLMLLNVNDGKDPSEPLEIDTLKPGCFVNIVLFDRRHAQPHRINLTDPFKENFREPETYRLANTSKDIHYTRIIRFDGTALPLAATQRNHHWGDSIFKRIRNALVNANIAADSTANLLLDSNVDVVKVKGLMNMLLSDATTKQLTDRFVVGKYLKSNFNFTLADMDNEDITKLTNTFTGIPEVLEKFMTILSAASDIPATRLFGKAPEGMNATGESDLVNYYDSVSSKQEFELAPALDIIDQIIAKSEGIDPDKIEYTFNPLWQLSDEAKATVKLTHAQADDIYFNMNIVDEAMVAQSAKNNGLYEVITDDWISKLEAAAKEAEIENEGNDETENEEPGKEDKGDKEEGEDLQGEDKPDEE